VRTVYRDIDALSQAGVPVAAMPGEGYRMVEGYHLPPIAFTAEEAVQLLLGADLARELGTSGQREATRAATAKVEAALRPETRMEVERTRERVRVSGWKHHEASPWLPALHRSVIEDRALRLRYHSFSSDEVTERDVEPYFLTYYSNDWHVVGYCRLRQAMRDFRASRIREATLLPEQFARRIDVVPYQRENGHDHQELRIWIEASTLPWAREALPYGFEREEPGEGGSIFILTLWDLRRVLPWILGWGTAARVLSPTSVADRVRGEAEALVQRYAEA
jgi:predicted DNA-binding transcriptional regulator YafY